MHATPSELILGGQRSGKSRCAERRAAAWLSQAGQSALLLATALPWDDEMRQRISRHQRDRLERVPGLVCEEVPLELAAAIHRHSRPQCLVVVDCLTLWLTNLLMPALGNPLSTDDLQQHTQALCASVAQAQGPVVLVSNEIGWGVSPLSSEARHFVDELGRLHQGLAACCSRVTLMVAGLEMQVKEASP